MYISDRRQVSELAESMPEDATVLDAYAATLAIIESALAERSWEGPFDQLTVKELEDILQAWAEQTEDDAIPPDDGTSSETSPQPGT
jgi:hypothetical protein